MKRINWEDVVSDVVFALALLQVAIVNQWGPSGLLPVAVAQVAIVRCPKKSVYNEGGWHGFAFLLGAVIAGDLVLNMIFKMMIPTQYASTVAVIAAFLVMVYSAAFMTGPAIKALFCRHPAAKYVETLGGARLQAGNISFKTPHLHDCPTCGRQVFLAEKRNE